jgi:hypothetical protein
MSGISASDEAGQAAARGNNLVVVTPPAAVYAIPGITGAIQALPGQEHRLLLVLVPEPALGEWESVIAAVARAGGKKVHAVRTLARASRLLQAGSVDILITPPDAALALTQRSTLKADQVAAVFIAWPELWTSDEALTPLMQDIGREVQRIVYTTEQDRVASLVERHARRAHTVGPITGEMPAPATAPSQPAKAGSIRLATTALNQRDQAVREVIELLDPAFVTVWTLAGQPGFAPSLPPGTELAVQVIPPAGLIIAYDIPTSAQLAQLAAAGDVVVLVPPTAQTWFRRVVPQAQTLRLVGAGDAAGREVQSRRQQIADALDTRDPERGLLALAPLLERYDATTVAAILYQLWQDRPGAAVPATAVPAPSPTPTSDVLSSATARVWVSVGKKDGATANDFVGVMTKELRYERSKIGKIEVRELYSLVEVPAAEAESLAGQLTGKTIRRRRVTARLDSGAKVRK